MKFWKMSGSGNDFAFFDGRTDPSIVDRVRDPDFVREVCAPHTGVGADGVCAIHPADPAIADFSLLYLNRDGSVGELCGNASLCATRLAVELGLGAPSGLRFRTDAGVVQGRVRDGEPEIDLQPATGLRSDAGISRLAGEERLGFVNTGVPHLVIRTDSVDAIELTARGPELRYHTSLKAGANVNWIAPAGPGSWKMRTYERGVEGETLACGTGAVACAELLNSWGESAAETRLETRSGRILTVRLRDVGGARIPSLAGEGRIVFDGVLREL
jgi:diaminopimelate epimerase